VYRRLEGLDVFDQQALPASLSPGLVRYNLAAAMGAFELIRNRLTSQSLMQATPHNCEQVVSIEQEPRHQLIISNEFVRGFAVEIAPHDRTLCHHHAHEYLIYVAGDAQIMSAPRDGNPMTHSYQDGDCEFSPPGLVHVVENLGDAKFRNLLVELLPGAQGLRRGPDRKLLPLDAPPSSAASAPSVSPSIGERPGVASGAGNVNITNRFVDQRISVFLLEMESRSQVEVFGPAIVASPYEHKVELAPSRASAHTLTRFTDLLWLDPSSAATLRNRARTAAKIVLIAVGQR
jgi:quercetin dioxygenase-like cupin family protein